MSVTAVLRDAGMGPVRKGRPLPLSPSGSIELNHAVSLYETGDGGVVVLYGMATWCYDIEDVVGRRLAAVQLVETKAATPTEVAAGFRVDFETLRRWRNAFGTEGISGLVPRKLGPRRPSKLTDNKRAEIAVLQKKGLGLRAIARGVGLDPSTVRRGLFAPSPTARDGAVGKDEAKGTSLVPLARPQGREGERALARVGLLCGAEPVICEGASLPSAGALLVLAALEQTGLLACFEAVFSASRAAFYSVRALVLCLVFSLLLGEPRAEGLTRIDPTDLGRLIGLDRAPEVKTMRRRMEDLAGMDRSAEVLERLAHHHVEAAREACGLFYVDGHVRAYHGSSRLPKAHLTRARLAVPAEVDTWICDAKGEGVLVWNAEPGQSLSGELKRAAEEIRSLVGKDARPTIAFDRGGYSPKLFAELKDLGFHILTYRKQPCEPEPTSAFSHHEHTDDLGREHQYLLADRKVRLTYKDKKTIRYFACRQVTRLSEDGRHQTQVLTTHEDWGGGAVAFSMFSRWREENFFRYLRHNYGLDAMDTYAKREDDLTREVPNPQKKDAAKATKAARAAVVDAEAALARTTLEQGSAGLEALEAAEEALEEAKAAQAVVSTRVPLGEVHPDAKRLDGERKRLHDAVRMATYNATSALARLLAPHYRRADDEARMILSEAFRSPADLEVTGDELHVRINPLSAGRRSRAIAGLCKELSATETLYPGTKLRLVYSVKGR
ncbi:MAG: putative transposase [Acidimicrobiales bacterium]